MDVPLQGEKENNASSQSFQNSYNSHQPMMQFLPPNLQQKKPKTNKAKAQKGFSTNLRAGDWVCLICSNLNFSFRNECNRCQIQTKEQNQIQSMYLAENPHIQNNDPNTRFPFQDLTNHKYSQSKPGQPGFHNKSKSTPMQREFDLNLLSKLPSGAETQTAGVGDLNANPSKTFSSNKGFQNMLLVTPPKHRQNKSVNIFKEYSDSSQKELPPYKSPEHLPSVSPILKKVFGYELKDLEHHDVHKVHNSLILFEEENEEFESPANQVMMDLFKDEAKPSQQYQMPSSQNVNPRGTKREDLGLFAHVNTQNAKNKQQLQTIDELSKLFSVWQGSQN